MVLRFDTTSGAVIAETEAKSVAATAPKDLVKSIFEDVFEPFELNSEMIETLVWMVEKTIDDEELDGFFLGGKRTCLCIFSRTTTRKEEVVDHHQWL